MAGENGGLMTGRAHGSPVIEPPSETGGALDLESVRNATELLRKIVEDRGVLASVPLELRQALLIAAGQASRPQSYQEKRLVKTLRRAKRLRDDATDRAAKATTGIRVAREAAVFVAPAPVPELTGKGAPVERPETKPTTRPAAEMTGLPLDPAVP